HQKLVEETPSPGVSEILRTEMISEVVKALETIGYLNAGTVECLVEPSTQKYYFIEMNARLQVEHAITEMVTGIDLVEHQLRIAGGESVTLERLGERSGHAIEFRICAEDPVTFLPSPGRISKWVEPVGEGVRVDSGYRSGNTVSRFYDSLLAKLIVHGKNRDDALAKAQKAIRSFEVEGLKTNLPLFNLLLESPLFVSGDYDTSIIEKMRLAS
ncbi:MAG: ATP-binding protein, partial [Acidimicrobiales bacterium]